jgi:hypothetical protein
MNFRASRVLPISALVVGAALGVTVALLAFAPSFERLSLEQQRVDAYSDCLHNGVRNDGPRLAERRTPGGWEAAAYATQLLCAQMKGLPGYTPDDEAQYAHVGFKGDRIVDIRDPRFIAGHRYKPTY